MTSDIKEEANAIVAIWVHALGLSTSDLAEIGNFSVQHARRMITGKTPPKDDVLAALQLIACDIDECTEKLLLDISGGIRTIDCYRTNSDLRKTQLMPARGYAKGGFAGAYMIAAYQAKQEFGNRLTFRYSEN